MTFFAYTLPSKQGVIVGHKLHICGEHPDGYPGCCGQTYYSSAGGPQLAGLCCKETVGFREWLRERKRQQDARFRARRGGK